MSELADILLTTDRSLDELVSPAVLRILADHHVKQADKWREKAKALPEEDRYLKGYIECLNDVAIGNRRLALMVEIEAES